MGSFFEELKRRKVFRVAGAYGVVAWLVIQISATVFPAWELPSWALRLVILIALLGFPVALVLAWAFDLTSSGIQTTPNLAGSATTGAARRRNVFLLAGVGIFIAFAAGFFLLPRVAAHRVEKSIAVLPFENFSDDKENAYFADGIQDDILTNLSKIGDLKVISRTSVMPYRGKLKNVREIASALGVSTVLEGSVRKAGQRIRVNVQLIDATTDEHLWAEDYDRDLTDVFAIQTDLAQKIAQELQAKLSPNEKAELTRAPTTNSDAYVMLLKARELTSRQQDAESLKQAAVLYDRVLKLDPNFALAYAEASRLQSWIYHSVDPSPEHLEKAQRLAERALQLQPDSPEAHLALGYVAYYGKSDYETALREFGLAQAGMPNDAGVLLAIGAIERRQGKWTESIAHLKKSAELSPNETWPLQNLALTYAALRDFDAANGAIDRALKLDANAFQLWAVKAQVELAEKGSFTITETGRKWVKSASMPEAMRASIYCGFLQSRLVEGNYAQALEDAKAIDDSLIADDPSSLFSKYLVVGIASKKTGDDAGARKALLIAKEAAVKGIAAAPKIAYHYLQLGLAEASLGEKDDAIAAGKRATELLPESVDAFEGPDVTLGLAEIYTAVGESDKAIDLLDGLLARPSSATVVFLEKSPLWDPLRENPRFQQMLKKHHG